MRSHRTLRAVTYVHEPTSLKVGLSGFAQTVFIALMCLLFVMGGLYLYSVNKGSVYGYSMRSLEKEIQELRRENGELRVKEAEVRALSRVESGSVTLRMEKVGVTDTLILSNAVALR